MPELDGALSGKRKIIPPGDDTAIACPPPFPVGIKGFGWVIPGHEEGNILGREIHFSKGFNTTIE